MGLFSAIGGIFGGFAQKAAAKRAQRRAASDRRKATAELKALENSRQAVINPYENTKDLSSLAKDLSGKISNPFASLGVATAAADMQAEQTDIALANTLDMLRATGASAGGATALAQAALQSKKGIAANIEQQEVANEKQRAAGEATLQRQKMAEAQRQQMADVQGEQYTFQAQETRDMQQLNRLSNQIGALRGAAAQASADSTAALTGGIGAAAGILGGADWG